MEYLSSLAQNLDALLAVASSLEGKLPGKLPGKIEAETKHTKAKTVFQRTHSIDTHNIVQRLIDPKHTYVVEKDFSKLQHLYEAIHGASSAELQRALKELQSRGAHMHTENLNEALLMCKNRLNAILMHVAIKKNKVEDLSQYKISWMPIRSR